ncbi:hypothetical protein PVIIG_06294 [Plasmodium vivax India VII]|uniref:Fam-l protein n=1 Tax=Plasmodium vivax India VII TaxID=1077284 RepID=A0A0J9SHA4_PLAVI|nr:hypothetical protein PVIIG_06294 [Plasmodium vivax India VII]
MTALKSAHSKHKVKFLVFIKILIFIILSCTYHYNQDENSLSKTLENGNKVNITLVMRTHRLLAKYLHQNEIPTSGLQNKVSYNRDNFKLEKGKRNNITYVELKQGRSNHFDEYLKSYKNRYSNKRGLKKLDCYFENKLFNNVDYIQKIGESLQNDKKSFIKKIFKIYRIRLMLLFLLPLLGLIFPMTIHGLYGGGKYITSNYSKYFGKTINGRPEGKLHPFDGHTFASITTKTYRSLEALNYIFVCSLLIIVLIGFVYTYRKLKKYRKLKVGKGKISTNV